jgi:hypothetical protein
MEELDVFVSYAREDEARVLPLVRALEVQGWRVFWDRTIPIGESWLDHIGVRLDAAAAVVVVWSRDSVKSEFVYSEASHARQRRALVPVTIDPVKPPLGLDAVQAADLVGWLRAGGVSPLPPPLVEAIRRKVPAKPSSASRSDAPTARIEKAEAPPARPPRVKPHLPVAKPEPMAKPEPVPIAKPEPATGRPSRRGLWTALGMAALVAGAIATSYQEPPSPKTNPPPPADPPPDTNPPPQANPPVVTRPEIMLSNTRATLHVLGPGDRVVRIVSDMDVHGVDANIVRSIHVVVAFRDSARAQIRALEFDLLNALLGPGPYTRQRFQQEIRNVSNRAVSADVWVEIRTDAGLLRSAPVNVLLTPTER